MSWRDGIQACEWVPSCDASTIGLRRGWGQACVPIVFQSHHSLEVAPVPVWYTADLAAPVLGSDHGESPNAAAQPADAEGRIPEPPLRRKIFSHIVRPSQTSMIAMESTLSLSDAKARFSEIVDRAINGEDFVITRMGRPAVRISRFEPHPRSRKLGDLAGQIRMSEDFEEWPPDLREALGMEPTK